MKRIELMKHLRKNGCFMLREGGNHSVVVNVVTGLCSTVPRHNEIDSELGRKICKDLGIPKIRKR